MAITAPEVTLGVRLYMARRRGGFSLAGLAALLPGRSGKPLNRQTLAAWEADESVPTLTQLEEIARLCDVELGWLVGAQNTYFAPSEQLSLFSTEAGVLTLSDPVAA